MVKSKRLHRGFNAMTKSGSDGFTLVEALIALLVTSIGLIGLAALHLSALSNAHSSYYRSISSTIALDLEERLWAFTAINLSSTTDCISSTEVSDIISALESDWTANNLTPSSGWTWTQAVYAGIPGLDIDHEYEVNVPPRRPYDGGGEWEDRVVNIALQITWTDDRFGGDTWATEQFDYVVRVPCVSEYFPP